uniref:Zinc finger CCCH domain-containing protein 15 homolog n=1 Tax=Dermatophagoides pteronyssinus TaxID=6956 RepID=A0A6P6Y7A1_DERPT
MPAKAKNAPSKKAVEKEKQKIIEDKTFGLKNKNKSKAVQNYIKSVTQQVSGGRCRNEHETKHQAANRNKTDIICKYFLSALENNLYGWRWECVNGEACMYRHALPAGYVLQKKAAAAKPDAATVPLEEQIEAERAALPSSLPPAT